MAVPISSRPAVSASEHGVRHRLERATLDHDEALLALYGLLQKLYDHGILDLLQGMVGAGGQLVTKLSLAADSEEAINATRNLISLARIAGSLDPDVLHCLADELSQTRTKETMAPPPGVFALLRSLVSQDARRGMAGIAAFTQAFGRALARGKQRSLRGADS